MKPKPLSQVCREGFYGEKLKDIGPHTGRWSRATRAAIREYEKRQWKPVSERPRKEGYYLTVSIYSDPRILLFTPKSGWSGDVKHWRPMPKGPKA
jgi:hypothetical protein